MSLIKIDHFTQVKFNFQYNYIGCWAWIENGHVVLVDKCLFDVMRIVKGSRINAAKRGIGLVNKLRPGPDKLRHAKRVFRNYNRLRVA